MKFYIMVGILLFASVFAGGCTQQKTSNPVAYVAVTPAEAEQLINKNPDLVIIDISPNYAEGHLPGAVSYDLDNGSFDKAIPTLDKSKKYLVYCHSDIAAIQGAQKLVDAGFEEVYWLKGGYQGWVDAGYPVEK